MLKPGYHNMDCMDGMKQFPDKYFDLAIVDPPYGIERFKNAQPTRLDKYGSLATANDLRPTQEYFAELFRVSKKQIVWGYNHLSDMLPTTKEFIFWYKQQPLPSFSDGELAWTSFDKTAKCFNFRYSGAHGAELHRIHPTQKPVALYTWLLNKYAKPGDKILDTHVGSASSLIACHKLGFEYVGFEIDPHYYKLSKQRLENEMAQVSMFESAQKNQTPEDKLIGGVK